MRRRGTPFAGLLYVGLALTRRGPRVVEFNARFGDPETQVVLPLLETPLATLLLRGRDRRSLAAHPPLRWRDGSGVVVVVAAAGYPGTVPGTATRSRAPCARRHPLAVRLDVDGGVVSGRRAGGRLHRHRTGPGQRAAGQRVRAGRQVSLGRLAPPHATSPWPRSRDGSRSG